MAIENSVGVQRLPWGGHESGGLPSGIWRASNTVVMDGSGGLAEAKLIFQFAADPLQGLVYHLGQLWITISGSVAAQVAIIKTASMGYANVGFGFDMQVQLILGNTENHPEPRDVAGMRNHLLGMPMTTGDDATLEVATNNVNGDVLLVTAIGYVWSQLAIGQAGFPQLPPGALWNG